MVWAIAEKIIYGLLKFTILGGSHKADNFADTLIQFFPLEAMSNLIKEPISRLSAVKTIEAAIGGNQIPKMYNVQFTEILIVSVWIIIFILTSFYILKKRDL